MGHTADADEFLDVPGNELGSVIADNPGMGSGMSLASSLDDRFDVALFQFQADLLVHDRPAITVEQTAKEEKCPPER
jgi:hypothetical protein